MISWKHSFEKISKDLELTRKKKQTLDNLFSAGKISQSTYDSLNTELSKAIVEIEARQKELAGQMSSKISELEEQVSTLEMLLASSELQYAAGEIDNELYAHESAAFGLGLEATKQELNTIKNIVASIMEEPSQPQPQLEKHEIVEAETPKTEEVIVKPSEAPIETSVEEKTIEVTTETQPETPIQMPTEAPTETVAEAKTENPPEAPAEISKEETTHSEEVTIEVIKEVKEEQVISSEPIAEKIVEEAPSVEVAEASQGEATFFRDPKEATEEKKHEKKEESKG